MTPLKYSLNQAALERLALSLKASWSDFSADDFMAQTIIGLEELELKERVQHIFRNLHNFLPEDFCRTAQILMEAKKHWHDGNPDDPCRSFAAWPMIDYVGVYGLDFPEESLECLSTISELFSAEFAIRPFIEQYPDLCQNKFEQWIQSDDEHVRRLVSEGTRPRLPWGRQLKELKNDPRPSLPLLKALLDDESLYVRKSVANHLNDISKDHPELLIQFATEHLLEDSAKRQWILKQAARTLIKAGHPGVWPLIGCEKEVKLDDVSLSLNKIELALGESLEFSFQARSASDLAQKLVIDYAVHYQSAKGASRRKVFKLKTLDLAMKEKIQFEKKIIFKPLSTRRLYAGQHHIEILINGESYGLESFDLTIDELSD